MDELFRSCPEVSEHNLTHEILEGITLDHYLFYRTGVESAEVEVYLGPSKPFWEIECTNCGGFTREKKRSDPPKHWTNCPVCGEGIEARRWNCRAVLEKTKFSYQQFQRGAGQDIWLRSWQVRRTRDVYDPLYCVEYQRILYRPGMSARWKGRVFQGSFVEPWKKCRQVNWSGWSVGFGTHQDVMGYLDAEMLRGSCLEYSQISEACELGLADLPAYLALYIKYPACEYLFKMGFGRLLKDREGSKSTFNKAVNLRAKRPDQLLRGLNRAEIKLWAKDVRVSVNALLTYRELRDLGYLRADESGVEHARQIAVMMHPKYDFAGTAARAGITPDKLRKWHEKQMRRSGHRLREVLGDHMDYLQQLTLLQITDGEILPHDLADVHERLSIRINALENGGLTPQFRARRHLLRWLCWRNDGLFIRPVDSPAEITREGERQRHCVAQYAKRHAAGGTTILLLRRQDKPRESYYTVEFDAENLQVHQVRGYRNQDNSPADRERVDAFINAWLRHLEMNKYKTGGVE